MDTDDKTILRRLKRGDAAALEAAVRQYSGYVTAVIGNQLGRALPQRTLRSWPPMCLSRCGAHRSRFGRSICAAGWARSRATRQSAFCGGSIYNSSGTRTASSSMTATRRSCWRRRSAARFLNAALAALTPEDREIFLRRYYYNQTAGQIAEALHMNPSTVRSRLLRGRQALRTELQKGDVQIEDLCAESV